MAVVGHPSIESITVSSNSFGTSLSEVSAFPSSSKWYTSGQLLTQRPHSIHRSLITLVFKASPPFELVYPVPKKVMKIALVYIFGNNFDVYIIFYFKGLTKLSEKYIIDLYVHLHMKEEQACSIKYW